METFRAFLKFEFNRFLTWQIGLLLGLVFALSMYLTNTGINQYQDILTSQKEFQDIERLKAQQWNNYDQYGGYGIYIYFIPSPLSIFFHNTNLFTELTAHVDVGERSNIYNSFKGKKIFSQKSGRFWDFAGVVLLFGSLMALYYGYDSFRDKEYLKFISSLVGQRRVFGFILMSRIILLCIFVFIATICALLLIWIRDIKLSNMELIFLLIFFLLMLLMMVFFFSLGTICGSIKSARMARFLVIVIWIGMVYFIPAMINKAVESAADKITSNYKSELQKVKTLMDFERVVKEKTVELRKKLGEEGKPEKYINDEVWKLMGELSEDYLKKGFQDIQKLERDLENQMRTELRYFQAISIIFPSSFYLSVNNEISSRGYENIIRFHQYAKEIKDKYVRFYVEKKYKTKPGEQPVESFVKKDENIYVSECRIPWNFPWGLLVTFVWIGGVFKLSYFLYRKSLFREPKEIILGLKDLEIDVEEGKSNVVLTSKKINVSNHLYNVLSGKNREFKGKVLLKGVNLAAKQQEIDFVYLCQPEEIPEEIRVRYFISFIAGTLNLTPDQVKELKTKLNVSELGGKNFGDLEEKDKGNVLLETALLKHSDIYMIYDFAKGMPTDFIKEFVERLERLKESGVSILYVTNDVFLGRKIGDYVYVSKKDAALMITNF